MFIHVNPGVLLQHAWILFSIPHFITRVRGTHIAVTPQIIADVLHVPRVKFPDHPSCERLRTVSKDELKSAFCESPYKWGEH